MKRTTSSSTVYQLRRRSLPNQYRPAPDEPMAQLLLFEPVPEPVSLDSERQRRNQEQRIREHRIESLRRGTWGS